MIINRENIESLLPKNIIIRQTEEKIKEHIFNRDEVTILYGARQVGKSTLILNIIEKEALDKYIIHYFNLDFDLKDFITAPQKFIDYLLSTRKEEERVIVFIDEAQRLKEIGLFVKYIYDRKLNIKFILTGSASLDIKSKIKEPLTGRKREFFLSSLSLKEILIYNGYNKIAGHFSQLTEILNEYMLFGGYPQIVTEKNNDEKILKLQEISDSYIFRDMKDLFDLGDDKNILTTAIFLAENIGNIISIDNIAAFTGIKRYEVSKIIDALGKTYVTSKLHPIHKDKSKELIHIPKIYFRDNGIRNILLNKTTYELLNPDKGSLFENTIYNLLVNKYGKKYINFWRTKNQVEVDFIVQEVVSEYKAYESKYLSKEGSLTKNLYSFQDIYKNTREINIISSQNYWKFI